MNMAYASLCLLSYKRPENLMACIQSLTNHNGYPYEVIVNADGGDGNEDYLVKLFKGGLISKLILNGGKNRGVGRSFENCLGVAEGDYIFKVDTDLTFKRDWLGKTIKVLEGNPDIGAISMFDYNRYDPNDERFKPENNVLEVRSDCFIVKDFVSSIYGFRRKDKNLLDYPIADDGNHSRFHVLAITREDLVNNHGFGVTKSVYVSGTEDHPFKTPTFNEPLIFKV